MAVTPVDILTLGDRRRQQMGGGVNTAPSTAEIEEVNRKEQQIQTLNRQVEVGLGSRVDNVMSDRDKQLYIDGLSDTDRTLMQKYKSEGYGFMASKALVENKKKLADPYQNGTNKYKDYNYKEQYYNNSGLQIDGDSALGKVALWLQKIGFNDQDKNPINKITQNYNERYTNEREAIDLLMENKDASNLEKVGRWLQRTLMTAESSIINAINSVSSAGQGVGDIAQSSMTATLDNAILGLDTDQDFYRNEDRRLDEYLIEGAKGGATLVFRAMAPKVMATFTAIGETKTGGEVLERGDKGVHRVVNQALKTPGIKQYYNSLDEQGQEDMLDLLTTGVYYVLMKRAGKGWEKFKADTKPGQWVAQQETYLQNARNLFKESLKAGVKGAKDQIGKEVQNRKTATDMYDGETGKISGKYGEQGETGLGNETSRVVKAGVEAFKNKFRSGVEQSNQYNAGKRGGAITPYDPTQSYQTPTGGDTPVGKPTNPSTEKKGVIGKAKEVVQNTWDDMMTGLTPEERTRIKNDPYVKDKFDKALGMIQEAGMPLEESFITEQLYNEIGDKIIKVFDEWDNKLGETSPYYNAIRGVTSRYDIADATAGLNNLMAKNDITVLPTGELDFSNSKFVSDADMRSVQRAWDMVTKALMQPMTPREYLNLRSKLDQLAKYTTVDASRGQSLIRQIRHTADGVAKKQIPGLKEIDDVTSKYFREIAELKDGWVYKGGDRKGEIRNNFYSIIKNLTGHNRKVMLQRLEKYYPGISEEIEAVHLTAKLVKAYNKSPQIVKAMGVGGGIAGGSGGNIVKAFIGAIIGEMAQEGVIRPLTKSRRMKAIDKLLSEMSPEAQAKLQEIALKQTYAKELSAEDQRVLEKVADIIAQEREKGLSEDAIREREERTKKLDQEALPQVQPDIVDENGNITLGRGNPISPDKGAGRPRRLTRINEINLKNTEAIPDKQALNLSEKLNIDTETAMGIQDKIGDFLAEIGADETGTIGGRNVNYEKFSTKALEELMTNDSLPKTEKEKIESILAKRGSEVESKTESQLNYEYAYEINKLSEEEQRIGKVGKNKVGKEYANKQMRIREKKKERLIEKISEDYGIDQREASDKYTELEQKGTNYINNYKKTEKYATEQAEREILNGLMEGWGQQPKFVRDMNEGQLAVRQELLNNVQLQDGYKLETTDYNDRYIKEENGNIVDRGAIKYKEDGRIEIGAMSIDGLKASGLIDSLPNDTIVRVSGEEGRLSIGDMKEYQRQDDMTAGDDEIISYEDALLIKDFKNGRTAKELADEYGLSIDKIDSIITGKGMKAFGRYKGGKIEILENPKVSTLHHEIFHGAMDIVDAGRKADIIETVMKRKGMNEGDANEWLAEKFSEYARTGEFDKGELPKTAWQKIKSFFKKVKERFDEVWKDRKKIQKLFDDILEVRIRNGRMTDAQKYKWLTESEPVSRLKGDEFPKSEIPLLDQVNDYYTQEYNNTIYRNGVGDIKLSEQGIRSSIAHGIGRNKASAFVAVPEIIRNGMELDHQINRKGRGPDRYLISAPIEINRERYVGLVIIEQNAKLSNEFYLHEVLLQKNLQSDEFWTRLNTSSSPEGYMNVLKRLKDASQNEKYQYQAEQKSLFDIKPELTPFEQYFKEHSDLIDIMGKTYDPDIVERQGNLLNKGFSGLKIQDLYEIRNLLEDYIKEKGQVPVSNEIGDNTTLDVLVEKANRIKKNQKIGSYDKKQIQKIGGETNKLLENRITDVSKWMKSIDPDVYEYEFAPQVIYEIGKAYDPDISKRQENLKEPLNKLIKTYGQRKSTSGDIIQDSALNSLKSKIKELEKYSYKDIFKAFEGEEMELFMRAVKPRIEELQAQGVTDAVTNLVAVSNMSVENFKKQMENFEGKSPMPSIAVMDVNVPHEVFGDLTLVFGRNTVDPKVDPANKLYGSDAWTPTFPEIEKKGGLTERSSRMKALDDIIDPIRKTLQDAGMADRPIGFRFDFGEVAESWLNQYSYRKDLQENSYKLAEQIMEDIRDDSNLGVKDYLDENPGLYSDIQRGFENLFSTYEGAQDIIPAKYFDTMPRYRNVDAVAEDLSYYVSDEVRGYYDEGDSGMSMIQRDIKRTLENNTDSYQRIATILDAIESEFGIEYSPEVEKIVRRLQFEEPGDRPLTPENVLEAMKNQRNNREVSLGGYKDMIEIEGHELNDVEDVRRQNFAKVFHGDRTGDLGDLEMRYYNMLSTLSKEFIPPEEGRPTMIVVQDAIKNAYSTDVNEFQKNIMKEYSRTDEIPKDLLQRIIDVVEQGKKIPIRFSESKPQRIVDLNREVEYILVPEEDKAKVDKIVKGTPLEGRVVEYTPDNYSAPRSKKMKELQKKYGNVFFSMGGVIMPIAMLYLMMEQEEGQA